MPTRSPVAASAQACFPRSANRNVVVANAWRPHDGHAVPPPGNWEPGWTHIGKLATAAVLVALKAEGYTWVNLMTGGTAKPQIDVPLARLI